MHMSLWGRLFFVSIAIASAQTAAPGQNDYRFPDSQILATQQKIANYDHPLRKVVSGGEQKDIKYTFLGSKMLQAGYPSEQATIDLPPLPLHNWNEAHIHLDKHSGTHSIRNTTRTSYLEMMDIWHHRKIDYLEFVKIEALQQDRLQVVTHPDFDAPVLIKVASFPWEQLSLERESTVYGLLHGSGATPEFLGHVTEGGRVIGFITEYITEAPSVRGRNMRGCLAALRSLHQRGIAHGDAHDGNCLIRKDGSAVLIDFELSVETWSHVEFERDLDIISRCIQELSGNPY